jgi:ElaB/YqjD/DUF883 family membrane-anchored ribosome-binding protein
MDQDERAEGAAVSAPTGSDDDAQETRTPDEIRSDIDDTREEVGDTVEALAAKTDVKTQARERIEAIKGNVRAKADQAKAKAQSTTPESAQQGGEQLVAKVRENPIPVAFGAAVLVAFLIGRRTGRP